MEPEQKGLFEANGKHRIIFYSQEFAKWLAHNGSEFAEAS
jgi:hypothetical protein